MPTGLFWSGCWNFPSAHTAGLLLREVANAFLARLKADLYDGKANVIRALVEPGAGQDLGQAAKAYGSMRTAFDFLFFEMDIETRAFVDQSDERVKNYEETLRTPPSARPLASG